MQKHTRCKNGSDVVLIKVDEGGHTWPGSAYAFDQSMGRVAQQVCATSLMWEFFQTLPSRPAELVLESGWSAELVLESSRTAARPWRGGWKHGLQGLDGA